MFDKKLHEIQIVSFYSYSIDISFYNWIASEFKPSVHYLTPMNLSWVEKAFSYKVETIWYYTFSACA